MVVCVGGYYREVFQGFLGMAHGEPMYTAIFNVLVYVVVNHWVSLVTEGEEGPKKWVRGMQNRAAFFCAGYGLITSTQPEWLQGAFDALTGMLDHMGIWTNVGKMARMIFQSCCTAMTQS